MYSEDGLVSAPPSPSRRSTDSSSSQEEKEALSRATISDYVLKLREWAGASRLRTTLVGGGLLTLVAATVGSWLFIAQLTVAQQAPTLEDIYEAYDRHDYEEARILVVKLIDGGALKVEQYGGPLFVLGAAKAAEAKGQWSTQHRRSGYLIASKYLREAESFGFPEERKLEGMHLLGQSLIEIGEVEDGTSILQELLFDDPPNANAIHLAIANAYLQSSEPQLIKALEHFDKALDDSRTTGDVRSEALLNRIDILIGLSRFAEAREAISQIHINDRNRGHVLLTTARLDLAEARQSIAKNYAASDLPPELRDAILRITKQLESLPADSETTEQALYLSGLAHIMAGDTPRAYEQFEQIRRRFSGSPVGIAASIAEGDLLRTHGNPSAALTAYHRSLDALEEPRSYQNRLLPLGEVRQRLLAAHADFVAKREFESARKLVDLFYPLLSRTRQLELRATTLRDWGDYLISQRETPGNRQTAAREGRLHLREAGMAFEELARRRFATSRYPDEVWQSAECYFLGQSYTEAIRMFDEYLKNEPTRRNAQALLRLGQARLALRDLERGMLALEECIELHPNDASVYRARLDAAKACRDLEQPREAERLLLANLNDSGQTPDSSEWRDSLFELGHLLYDEGRYMESARLLQEAVERYPMAEQSRLATYLMGSCYRHAAETPLTALEQAQTVNEREKAASAARDLLLKAYQHLESVRKQISSTGTASSHDLVMLRNCYMFEGSVLFHLGRIEDSPERFSDAIEAYSNVSTLFHDHPFVLEPLVQIAACQRRLGQQVEARLRVKNALEFLERMPKDVDFRETTNLTRHEWEMLLKEMLAW